MDLECLRVPHFYRGFYVYKYATGMSAAMALVDRVTHGGQQELNDYLGFLKGGCSKDPLDLLRGAGVDMEKPDRVDHALAQFGQWVKELDRLLWSARRRPARLFTTAKVDDACATTNLRSAPGLSSSAAFRGSSALLDKPAVAHPTITNFRLSDLLQQGDTVMLRRWGIAVVCLLCSFPWIAGAKAAEPTAVVCDKDASPAEKLAGREIRRYFYLRTGKLLPIVDRLPGGGEGGLIVVGAKNRPVVQALLSDAATKDAVDRLAAEQCPLKTLHRDGRPVLLVVGETASALYGAYRFAEQLGVASTCTATSCPTGGLRRICPHWTKPANRCSIAAGFSRFTISPRGRTGGTATLTRRSSANCRSWG